MSLDLPGSCRSDRGIKCLPDGKSQGKMAAQSSARFAATPSYPEQK
jgi:hypothetical protein